MPNNQDVTELEDSTTWRKLRIHQSQESYILEKSLRLFGATFSIMSQDPSVGYEITSVGYHLLVLKTEIE